jgi:formylglycine-generating enzyme required for sulfatase activity
VGADLDAPLELLQLEVEVRTGTRFDAVGQRVLPLSATEYARYRSRYSEVAARHGSKCGYPESNLFLNVSSDARAAGSEAQIGEVFRDCSTCPEMVVIPVGQFVMGGAGDEAFEDERPQHEVEIGQSFAMGRFEITRAQYEEFVRDTGTEPSGCRYRDFLRYKMDEALSWRDPGFRQTDGDPAVCVSWEDAQRYVDWLSKQTGRPYRLPSEAEWEYAARGGSASPRYWGDSAVEGCSYANGADQTAAEAHRGLTAVSCRDSFAHTAPTGRYRANAFGLYDMLGNVWEWVEDCWNESYAGAPADGRPWLEGDCERRVQRGGSFLSQPVLVRVSGRDYADRTLRTYSWGFRVATTLK